MLDTHAKLPAEGPLFDLKLAPTLVVTASHSPHPSWTEAGVEWVCVPANENGVDLRAVMVELGCRGVLQLLVEGGSQIFESFWSQGLVNQLRIYVGPRILGQTGLPLFGGLHIPCIDSAPQLQLLRSRRLGSTQCLDFLPTRLPGA